MSELTEQQVAEIEATLAKHWRFFSQSEYESIAALCAEWRQQCADLASSVSPDECTMCAAESIGKIAKLEADLAAAIRRATDAEREWYTAKGEREQADAKAMTLAGMLIERTAERDEARAETNRLTLSRDRARRERDTAERARDLYRATLTDISQVGVLACPACDGFGPREQALQMVAIAAAALRAETSESGKPSEPNHQCSESACKCSEECSEASATGNYQSTTGNCQCTEGGEK